MPIVAGCLAYYGDSSGSRVTWSLSHTINYTTSTDWGTAWTYLFDTLLPTKGWTVTAGDDTFSRFTTTTVRSGWDNSVVTIGWFSDWVSGSGTKVNMYWDTVMDGVTVPSSTWLNSSWSSQITGTFQFWTSDAHDGVLVTNKGRILWFWPGSASKWWNYGSATPSTLNGTGSIYPWSNQYWINKGAPVSASSTGNAYMGAMIEQPNSIVKPSGDLPILTVGASFHGRTSTSSSAEPKGPILTLPQNDIYTVQNNTDAQNFYSYLNANTIRMRTVYDGTKYYLSSATPPSAYVQLWFDFGATLPPLDYA